METNNPAFDADKAVVDGIVDDPVYAKTLAEEMLEHRKNGNHLEADSIQKLLDEAASKKAVLAAVRQGVEDEAPEGSLPAPTTAKDAVFQVYVEVGRPLSHKELVAEFLASNLVPLSVKNKYADMDEKTAANKLNAFTWQLANRYENVLQKTSRGVHIIHPDWNGRPLDEQRQIDQPAQKRNSMPGREQDAREEVPEDPPAVIPCYGIRWDRELVSWDRTTGTLFGKENPNTAPIDFASQVGVYILHDTNNVVYVGRTTMDNKGLYTRLRSHVYNPRRANRWTHFSWFGLREVDEDTGMLGGRRADLDVDSEVVLMETVLIEALSPAFNDKGGDNLGAKYEQEKDPVIKAKEQADLRESVYAIMRERWK